MSQDKDNNSNSDQNTSNSDIKASIYECTDTNSDGGTVHTRIFCFETDRPIKK